METALVIVIFAAAAGYLVWRHFKNRGKTGCDGSCGCSSSCGCQPGDQDCSTAAPLSSAPDKQDGDGV